MDNFACEVKRAGVWVRISIQDALEMDSVQLKRCPECHGRVRAHKDGKDGPPQAHFEHFDAHAGCSKSVKFKGVKSAHPKAVT